MNSLKGVGTLASRPRRTTAPVHASSSEGLPSAMSLCRDAVPGGSRESTNAIVLSRRSCGNVIPRATATARISRMQFSSMRRVSGTVRITPIGARVSAPRPPKGTINANFLPHGGVYVCRDLRFDPSSLERFAQAIDPLAGSSCQFSEFDKVGGADAADVSGASYPTKRAAETTQDAGFSQNLRKAHWCFDAIL